MSDKLTTPLSIPELAASPSNPSSGYQKIYAKSDGKLYVRTSAGTETELTNVAGSGNIYTTDGTIPSSISRTVTIGENSELIFYYSDNSTEAININSDTGTISIRSMSSTTASPGENVYIEAGEGGIGGSTGGNIYITSGYGPANGGHIYLTTGLADGPGSSGGNIVIDFGTGDSGAGQLLFSNYIGSNDLLAIDPSGFVVRKTSKILTLEFGVSSGDVITTGAKGRKACTVSGTITGWKLITDTASTITVDVWKANNSIPTNSNSITASAKPSITGGQYASSTTLTGWTTSVSDDDVFVFEVESNDNAKYILLILEIEI